MWTHRQIINFTLIYLIVFMALTCAGVAVEKFFLGVEPGRSDLFPRGFGLLLMLISVPCTVFIGNRMGWLDGLDR